MLSMSRARVIWKRGSVAADETQHSSNHTQYRVSWLRVGMSSRSAFQCACVRVGGCQLCGFLPELASGGGGDEDVLVLLVLLVLAG